MEREVAMAYLDVDGVGVAVFDVEAWGPGPEERWRTLTDLLQQVRFGGLKVWQGALRLAPEVGFHGPDWLVRHLQKGEAVTWTHRLRLPTVSRFVPGAAELAPMIREGSAS